MSRIGVTRSLADPFEHDKRDAGLPSWRLCRVARERTYGLHRKAMLVQILCPLMIIVRLNRPSVRIRQDPNLRWAPSSPDTHVFSSQNPGQILFRCRRYRRDQDRPRLVSA